MKKSIHLFGVLSGTVLLPFTIRDTRRQTIDHFLESRGRGDAAGWATPKDLNEIFPDYRVVPVEAAYEVKP